MFLGGQAAPTANRYGIGNPKFQNNVMSGELAYALEGYARFSCDPDASLKIVETRFRVTPKSTDLRFLSGHRHASPLCRRVPLNMKRVHRYR